MTQEQAMARIAELEAANQALLAANQPKPRKITVKRAEKTGAVSVYGFGKWPVTLYASQWESLINQAEAIKGFIDTNRSQLASKEG